MTDIKVPTSATEELTRQTLRELFHCSQIPQDQQLDNLELFMRPQRISEIVMFFELYSKIIHIEGQIMEFGVRWGRHLSVLTALRTILEPYNYKRKIVGFDTFCGLTAPQKEDSPSEKVYEHAMSVTPGYEKVLSQILDLHEKEAPMAHISKHELIKGDAPIELEKYLKMHPECIVSLAYFDMDLYQPTMQCLELILPYMSQGSIIAFDELCHPDFPGETLALKHSFTIGKYELKRFNFIPYPCYIILK